MHYQIKIVELRAGKLKEVSRKTSRGAFENRCKLYLRNVCSFIECSGRAAAQDYLLNRVRRLLFFRQAREANCLARQRGTWNNRQLPAPLSYFLYGRKRRRVVHFKHGGIFDLGPRK